MWTSEPFSPFLKGRKIRMICFYSPFLKSLHWGQALGSHFEVTGKSPRTHRELTGKSPGSHKEDIRTIFFLFFYTEHTKDYWKIIKYFKKRKKELGQGMHLNRYLIHHLPIVISDPFNKITRKQNWRGRNERLENVVLWK